MVAIGRNDSRARKSSILFACVVRRVVILGDAVFCGTLTPNFASALRRVVYGLLGIFGLANDHALWPVLRLPRHDRHSF